MTGQRLQVYRTRLPTVNLPHYCLTVDQVGWQQRLTRAIAREIRRHRLERKLSAQKLADRCERLGFAVPRSVIANLENGYREALSVAELLVLAFALDIPPALLLFPVGRSVTAEVLPGQEIETFAAAEWFGGQIYLESRPAEDGGPGLQPAWGRETDLALYSRHQSLVFEWNNLLGQRDPPGHKEAAAELGHDYHSAERVREMQRVLADDLRRVRANIRSRGLEPPELPDYLAHIDGQDPARGSR